jgi:hypothetical protein
MKSNQGTKQCIGSEQHQTLRQLKGDLMFTITLTAMWRCKEKHKLSHEMRMIHLDALVNERQSQTNLESWLLMCHMTNYGAQEFTNHKNTGMAAVLVDWTSRSTCTLW